MYVLSAEKRQVVVDIMFLKGKIIMKETKVIHNRNLCFSIIAEYDKEKPYYVEFKILEIVAQNISPPVLNLENLMWHKEGSSCHPDPTDNINDAELYLSGSIKWDGCSNWMFENSPYHFCGRDSAINIGKLLENLYNLAKDILKETEDDI